MSEDLWPAEFRVDRTAFSVAADFDDTADRAYWHSVAPDDRLRHMEILRRINYGDQATARLQRVLEVVECPWG
jgi:hypothetical protein